MRGVRDRFLIALARLVLSGFHRDVEVVGRERLPAGRPVLVVANHYNGFVDPVILVHVLGRLPRFMAKAGLWRRRLLRPLLWAAGMIPVHRSSDGPIGDANTGAFATTTDVLVRGGLVAIFPEGTTHDDPRLAPIRTGAARIALAARAAGAEGLCIVPIGMAFADKMALRSAVLAQVGDVIDLDAELGAFVRDGQPADDANRDAVAALTAVVEERLRAVSPDYADRREARILARAAKIACRSEGGRARVRLSDIERLAQRLAYAPARRKAELWDVLARYHLDLDLVGLKDHHVVPGYPASRLLVGFVRALVIVVASAVVWVPGVVVNVVPYWLVAAAGRVTSNPTMKGTARFSVALVVFPVTWSLLLWIVGVRDWRVWVLAFVLAPTAGVVAARVLEVMVRAWNAWRGWLAMVERRALLEDVRADRERVVQVVRAAVGEVAAGAPQPPPRAGDQAGLAEAIVAGGGGRTGEASS